MGHKGKFPSRAVDPCIASTSGSAISGQPPITVSKFKEKKHRTKNKEGAMKGEELFRFPCADCSIAKNEPENKTYTIAEFGEHYSNRHGNDDSGLFGCSMCDREFAAHSAALNHVKNCGVGVAVKDEQSRTLSQNSQPSRRATMRDTKPAGPQRARVTLNHPVSSLHSSFEEALQRSLNLYYSSVSIREKSAEKLSARKRKHSSQKSSPASDTSLVVRCAEPGDTGKYINRGISCNILSQVDTGTETDSTQTSRADLGDICWQCGVYQVKGFMGLYDDYNKRSEDFRVFSGTEEPVPAEQLSATIGLVDDRSGRSVHSPSTIDTASNRVFNSPAEDQQAVQAIAENIAAGVNCSNAIVNFSSVSPTECDSTTSPLFYSSASSAYIGVPRSRSTSDPHWTRYPAHTGQLTPTILAPEPYAQENMDATPVEETPCQIEPEFEVGDGALGHAGDGDKKEEETRFVDDSELSTIRAPQPQQQETPVKQATPTDEQVRKKMSIIAHMSKSTGVKSYLGKMSESIHIHDDSPPDDLNNPEEVKLKVRSRNVNPRAILEKIGCGVKESKLGKENEHGDSAAGAGCRLTASETSEVSVLDVTPTKPLTLSMTSIGKEIDRRVPPLKRYGPEIPPHLATAQVFEESRMNGGSDEQSSAPIANDRNSAASSTHIEEGANLPFSLPAPIPVPVSQHSESSVLQPFSGSAPLLLPVQMQLFQGYDGRPLFDWSGYRETETSAPQGSVDGYSLPKKRKRESEDAVIDVEGGGDDPTVIGHPSSIISQASPRTSDDIISATTPSKQELSLQNDLPLSEEAQSLEMKQCVIDSTDDEYESPGQQRISEIPQPVVETAEPEDVVMNVERRSPDEVPAKMPDRDSKFSEDGHRSISKIRTQPVAETAEPKEVVGKVERRSPDEVPPKMADRDSKFSEHSHRSISKTRTQPVAETAEPKEVVVKVERCSPDTESTKMSASLFSEVPKKSPCLLLEKRIHESPVKNKSDLVGNDVYGEDACTGSSKFKEVPMCGFRKPSSASHRVRESLRHSHSVTKKTRTRATTSIIGNSSPARQPAFASVREKKPNIALRLPEQGAYIPPPPPPTVEFEKRKSKKEKKEKRKKSDGRHKHPHPGSKERSPHLHHAKKRQDKEEPVVLMTQDVVKESPREVVEAVKVEKRTSRRIEPVPDPVKAKKSDVAENVIAKEAQSPEGDVKWSPNSDDSKGGCLPSSAPVYSSMSTSDIEMPNAKNFSEFQSIVSPSDLLRLQANVAEKEKKDKMQSYIRFPAFFEMMENVIYEYCNGDPPGYFGTQYRDDYVKKLIEKTGNPHIERQLWFPDVVVKTESDMDVVTTTTNSEPTSDKEEDARKDKEEREPEPEREREESTKEDSFCSRAAQVARTMPFVDYETPYQHAEYWLSELTTRCGGLVNLHVECELRRDNTTYFVKMRLADELPTILSAVGMHSDKSEARLRAAFRLMVNLGKVAFFTANRPGQKMFAEKIVRAELFIRFIFDKMSTPAYDELKYLRAEAVSCSRKCCQLMDEAGSHVRLMFPIKMRQVERDDYGHWKEVPRKTYEYRPNARNGGRYGHQDSWRRSAESTTSGSLTTSGFKSNPTYRPPSRENRERRSGGFGDLLPYVAPVAESRPEVSTSSQPPSQLDGHMQMQRPDSNSNNNVHCARPQSSQSRETCVDPRLDTEYIRERERARESRRSEQQMEVPQDPRRRQRPSSALRSDERAAKVPKRQHSVLGREKSSESWIKREADTVKTEEAAIIVLPTINVCSYASQERRKSLTQREDEYKKHGYAGFNGVPILCVPPPPPPRPPPQRDPYVAEGYAASWAEPRARVSYHEEAASQTQRSSRNTQEKDLPATYARHLGSEDEERSRPVYQRTYGQSAKSEREKSKGRKLYKPSPLHPGNVEAYKQEHGSPIVHQGGEVPQLEEDKDIRSDSVGRHTRRTESVDRHSSDSRRSLSVTHRNDWSQQDQQRRRSGPVNYSNNTNNNNQRWRDRGGQRDMNRGQDVNYIKTDGWRWRNNGGNGGQGHKGLNTDQQRDRRSCSNGGGGGRRCRPNDQDRPSNK